MRGIPWSTIALGSLLLISVCSKGDRKRNLRNLKTRSRLPKRSSAAGFWESAACSSTWYAKHLGFADQGQGVMLPWREKDDPQNEHVTVWSVFPGDTKYFGPGNAQFMINYIVDDMDAFLDRMKQEGVKIDPKRQDESYGRFAWIYDSDGNKIELWQPLAAKK